MISITLRDVNILSGLTHDKDLCKYGQPIGTFRRRQNSPVGIPIHAVDMYHMSEMTEQRSHSA